MENLKMKTAIEILKAKFEGMTHKIPYPGYEWQEALIIAAMEDYAKQQYQNLEKELSYYKEIANNRSTFE